MFDDLIGNNENNAININKLKKNHYRIYNGGQNDWPQFVNRFEKISNFKTSFDQHFSAGLKVCLLRVTQLLSVSKVIFKLISRARSLAMPLMTFSHIEIEFVRMNERSNHT